MSDVARARVVSAWSVAPLVATAWVLVGCEQFVNSITQRDFEDSLSRLLTSSSPTTRLENCRLIDADWIAPAGVCFAYSNARRVAAMSHSLGLAPTTPRSATQLSKSGCLALPKFSRADTDVRVSPFWGRADFAYVALFFDPASGSLCVEARVAWG